MLYWFMQAEVKKRKIAARKQEVFPVCTPPLLIAMNIEC